MSHLLTYLWEGSVCMLVLYGFYRIFLTQHTFFAWNRIYFMLSLTMILFIPLLSIPSGLFSNSPILSGDLEFYLPTYEFNTENNGNGFSFLWVIPTLFTIYFIGVAVAFVRVSTGLVKLFHQIRTSEKFVHQGSIVSVHPDFQPSSFFDYILLPEFDLDDKNHQLIISHERLHAGYHHTVDRLFFQMVKIIFWFHPLIKMTESSLCEIHEYQVDDEVTKIHSKSEYANLLINLIIAQRSKQLINNFNQFQTKKRIIMMGRTKSNLMQKSRFLLALPLMALLIGVISCERQDDFELILDTEANEGQRLQAVSGEIFDVVENAPNPAGGMEGWNKYLSENLSYPAQARKLGIEGTVYVVFVVEEDGTIQGAEILRGIGGGCDEEALRVIKNSPDWTPGTQRDRKVNVRMRVPIRFKLNDTAL